MQGFVVVGVGVGWVPRGMVSHFVGVVEGFVVG